MGLGPDIAAGRLSPQSIADAFAEIHPPLDRRAALIESSRCYFCYDAPCIEACPTGIDIPSFIHAIASDNVRGAAKTIFDSNILGGMCARVCPVEELCEEACVRNHQENKPVAISALQRYATDHVFKAGEQLYSRAPATGRRIAIVGAGPAGLACAHRLAMLGHDAVIYEAREKGGGLNEYGLAAYKMAEDFAQAEIDFLFGIGGITLKTGIALGRDIGLDELRRSYDVVFLGLGHAAVNALGVEGETMAGVENAVDWIARLRQAEKAQMPVGRRVVVIGGGNTAIDVATQARRLGAEDVTLVYRRGPDEMSATWKEQEWTQTNGVRVKHWARPTRILGWPANGQAPAVREIEFEYTQLDAGGRMIGTGDRFTLLADQVFKAIGQRFVPTQVGQGAELLEMAGDRIAVNADRMTSLDRVWAGGDCVPGTDLTVSAVQDGKVAAIAIDRMLRG
jgi:dihydropyrimidine dehydrogenase (NAD+) subunit PreT